jgi:hypothetical protein
VKKTFFACTALMLLSVSASKAVEIPDAPETSNPYTPQGDKPVVLPTVKSEDTQAPPPRRGVQVPLYVKAVFATRVGEKKTSSIPYSFTCLATDEPVPRSSGSGLTVVRFGTEVPIPVTTFSASSGNSTFTPATSFQYRNVGANIECAAQWLPDKRALVSMKFEQSSIGENVSVDKERSINVPMFKTRVAMFLTVFRDGQTESALVGTDPNTGETSSLDVTVTVMK